MATTGERTPADRLRERRQRVGLTQEQAASALGISKQYLSNLEIGRNDPPGWPLIARLAAFYQCSADYLLGLTDDPASELCSIDVEHIDIANGRIKVRGKWNKERWVYIGARTVKALLRYWAANGIEQGAAIRNERNERRCNRHGLFRTLQRMGERTRVDGVSPHALRRTFAVFHLRNGVDLYTLARLMGHEDIATLKVYLDLADTDAAEAHRRYTLLDEL